MEEQISGEDELFANIIRVASASMPSAGWISRGKRDKKHCKQAQKVFEENGTERILW